MAEPSNVFLSSRGGRRYRRKRTEKLEGRGEGCAQSHDDQPPSDGVYRTALPLQQPVSRRAVSAAAARGATLYAEPHPFEACFQRYKPLPAIGTHVNVEPHKHSSPTQTINTPPAKRLHHKQELLSSISHTTHTSLSSPLTTPSSSSLTQLCVVLPDGTRSLLTLHPSHPLSYVVHRALDMWKSSEEEEGGGEDGRGREEWILYTSDVPKRSLSPLTMSLEEAGLTTPTLLHLDLPPS